MLERFFVPAIGIDTSVRLTGSEAHHLSRVCRINRGDRIYLFDGTGSEWEAAVVEVDNRDVLVSVIGQRQVNRELPFSLTLACVPPKGDRLRWLVEKATELGVTRLVPLLTERATEQARGLKTERLNRWVIEASKQCGRNELMEVMDLTGWQQYIESTSPSAICVLAEPTARDLPPILSSRETTDSVFLAIGPEGGFTDRELELGRLRGWIAVSLGARVLRVETAALVLVARVTAGAELHQPIVDQPK